MAIVADKSGNYPDGVPPFDSKIPEGNSQFPLGAGIAAEAVRVTYASDGTTIPVKQFGVSASGTLGVLNATVELHLTGSSGFALDVRGTFVATITVQGTIDGGNWFTLSVLPAGSATNTALVSTATAAGAWVGNANGLHAVRVIATAYTSGTATIVLRAMQAAGVVLSIPTGDTSQTIGTITTLTNLTNMPKLGTTTRTPVWASGQSFTTSTTSARGTAITGTEVMISTDADCYVNIGVAASVTATVGAGSMFIAKGGPYTFQITTGQGVAAILASGTGRVTLLPVA